ncbi:DOF ZINC FINGER PROTEIN DOF1.4-RELATED, partial [Salix purpurea]
MGLTSLQVCMDSSDWLQGTINEDSGMDSSSPSGDMMTCSRPLIERRLRPPLDQALKCPRRYWTKGGTLRNIP